VVCTSAAFDGPAIAPGAQAGQLLEGLTVQHFTPALHLWHCLGLVAEMKLPAGHLRHVLPSVHSLPPHRLQDVEPPLAALLPGSHLRQRPA
jgi:hypothetical protein